MNIFFSFTFFQYQTFCEYGTLYYSFYYKTTLFHQAIFCLKNPSPRKFSDLNVLRTFIVHKSKKNRPPPSFFEGKKSIELGIKLLWPCTYVIPGRETLEHSMGWTC